MSTADHVPDVSHARHEDGGSAAHTSHDHSDLDHDASHDRGDQGSSHDHGAHHHGDHAALFRDRFWFSLVLSVPVVLFSGMFQELVGLSIDFPGAWFIAPILGTAIFFYGGWPFLSGAADEIRERQPGMMLLISMAITVAYFASLSASFGIFGVEVWWELALLLVVMLLGHWVEMRAIGQASGALDALAALLPDEAEIVDGSSARSVPLAELKIDDVVLVRSGGRIPADGVVIEGSADVDESAITGESKPVLRSTEDRVVAGTIATDSSIRVRIDAVGEETALAGIGRLVSDAQASRSRAQTLADRAAALLFYVALAAAAITAIVWTSLGQPNFALTAAVTVLIIACPHALGLAIPLVTAISTAMSARHGILVTDRLALEAMRTIGVIMFDKTGTLTQGKHRVTAVAALDGDTDALLQTAAAVEADSEHPVARAIVAAAAKTGDQLIATDFMSTPGRGVQATVHGKKVTVGGPAMQRELGLSDPDEISDEISEWRSRGASVIYAVEGARIIGAFALEDAVRPESYDTIAALQREQICVGMITGDAQQVADAVARDLNIDSVFAEVLPADKDKTIADLQQQGHRVAMVGDGVNDAPALARADVGIAIGAGTDVAVESAGIVLATSDPRAIVSIRRLSQRTYQKMVQNLWWAAGYNIIAIPLAAGALAWAGIVLPMAVGAVLMSLSTIIVAANAQLLRRTVFALDAVERQ